MKLFRLLILIALFFSQIGIANFDSNTLILTPDGHQRIGGLRAGDSVLSACKNNWHSVGSKIGHKLVSQQLSMVEINLPEDTVYASKNHYFYNASLLKWVRAQDLTSGDSLLSVDGKLVPVQSTAEATGEVETVSIEVDTFHNYFVSKHSVLVHNEAFTIGIAITWAFGSGAIEYVGAQVTVLVAGLIGAKLFKGSDNKYDVKPEINVDGWNNQGPGHEPDSDDDDDDDDDLADRINAQLAEILSEANRGKKTNGPSKIFEKKGGFADAQKDFNRLKLSNVRNIDKGKIGILKDGRKVNVRNWSRDGRPTLEISKGKKRIKIRYGKK